MGVCRYKVGPTSQSWQHAHEGEERRGEINMTIWDQLVDQRRILMVASKRTPRPSIDDLNRKDEKIMMLEKQKITNQYYTWVIVGLLAVLVIGAFEVLVFTVLPESYKASYPFQITG